VICDALFSYDVKANCFYSSEPGCSYNTAGYINRDDEDCASFCGLTPNSPLRGQGHVPLGPPHLFILLQRVQERVCSKRGRLRHHPPPPAPPPPRPNLSPSLPPPSSPLPLFCRRRTPCGGWYADWTGGDACQWDEVGCVGVLW